MTIELPERTSWTDRRLSTLALIPVAGLVWWVVGFLPWFLDGLGHEIFGGDGFSYTPMALPLFAGNVSALVLGGGVGGIAAGLVTLLARGSRSHRALAAAAGVVVALVATIIESRLALDATVMSGIDGRVTNGITAILVVTTIVALGLGLLALTGSLGVGLALAGIAGAVPMWLANVFHALSPTVSQPQEITRWVGAAVLGVALVTVGFVPAARAVAWIGAVLLAWCIGPTLTAAGYFEVYLRPGMGLPDMLGDALSGTADVWRMAASPDARPLTPWIAAIGVAAMVALVRLIQQSEPSDPVPVPDPSQ